MAGFPESLESTEVFEDWLSRSSEGVRAWLESMPGEIICVD